MSLSIAGCFGHLRQLLGRLVAPAERLSPHPQHVRDGDPRTAATISLLGVLACAALTLLLPPRPVSVTAAPADRLAAGGTAAPPGPVRIVGATPRSDDCREQVWPYIEPRCLTRVDRPKAKVEAAAPIAADARERIQTETAPAVPTEPIRSVQRERVTAGAAPAVPAEPIRSSPAAAPARSRVATAYLAMPRPRLDPMESIMAESASDGFWLEEPRRHGRRGHRFRSRHRGFFLFPF